jgi:hypothetical protein
LPYAGSLDVVVPKASTPARLEDLVLALIPYIFVFQEILKARLQAMHDSLYWTSQKIERIGAFPETQAFEGIRRATESTDAQALHFSQKGSDP